MLVGWSPTLRLAVVGAVYTELSTRPARYVTVVALDLAHTAHVTGPSQSSKLRVDSRVAHNSSISRYKLSRQLGRMRHAVLRLHGRMWLLVAHDFGGSYGGMLESLGTVHVLSDSMGGIAGGLEHFEPIARVRVSRRMGVW